MKRFLLGTVAAIALAATPALAADVLLPAKAPPIKQVGFPYNGSGFYGGIGVVGEVLSTSVSGTAGTSNVFAAGAAFDVTLGYQWGWGSNWAALEGSADYENVGSAANCGAAGCGATSHWELEQRFLLGFPIQQVLAVLPEFGAIFPVLPALPNGVVTTNAHPYIYFGAREKDVSAQYGLAVARAWEVQPTAGFGIRNQWTSGLAVDTSAGCSLGSVDFTLGGPQRAQARLGSDCRAALRFLY